ncbi:hypothetical protein N7453_011820 [Penicillium expansum]|nr:hypothetical protein N7453_011820 [Penicillium expansum]
MAFPSYNISLDDSSPSYGPEWDTSGYKGPQVSPTRPFSTFLVTESSMSPNRALYNHHMQYSSAPLDRNFLLPAAWSDQDLYRPTQYDIRHSLSEENGAAKSLSMDGVILGPDTAAFVDSSSFNYSAQEIPQPKDNAGRRGARKQSPGCNWKDCPYPGMFSRKGVLMRHIETQHVNPRSFGCPKCDRLFSRKDNMTEHLGRVHLERV